MFSTCAIFMKLGYKNKTAQLLIAIAPPPTIYATRLTFLCSGCRSKSSTKEVQMKFTI